MLTQEDDVDAHALHRRGWTISAIARHLGHDRKTIRAYLNGERTAGVRTPAGEDRFAPFVEYCQARLVEDPHLWAETLLDELRPLGFVQSYSTLTRQIRLRGLRPACEALNRPVFCIRSGWVLGLAVCSGFERSSWPRTRRVGRRRARCAVAAG